MASSDPESDVDIDDTSGNSDESEDEFMGFNEDEIDAMWRAQISQMVEISFLFLFWCLYY